jgi:transcriptional regulator GlxA family with amidase domain
MRVNGCMPANDMYAPMNDMTEKLLESSPTRLGLLLTHGFALMSYASLIEPFRAANALAKRSLYSWSHVSPDGCAVLASNGASILADFKVGAAIDCDMLFVFAGGEPSKFKDRATFSWLRDLALKGVALAGVSGGPYLLARAGLLNGYRATIHWEHAAAYQDAFPQVEFEDSLFVIDRRRITCAGGTAGLDLALDLIERDHGAVLARDVGEWFIRTDPRSAKVSQRARLQERYRTTDSRLLRVLHAMEDGVESPPPRDELARSVGLSVRQLERLFRKDLGASIADTGQTIRLEHAFQLLRSTDFSVTEVSLICGFRSTSHFSRVFKQKFERAPSACRR